jgi:hypothetical protein
METEPNSSNGLSAILPTFATTAAHLPVSKHFLRWLLSLTPAGNPI